MGKNYYCEYCDKRFKDDLTVRKKHINGLPHQTACKEHYARFKSKFPLNFEFKIRNYCIKGMFSMMNST